MPDRRRAWAAALFAAAPGSEARQAYGEALDALASLLAEGGASRRAGLGAALRDPAIPRASKAVLLASALEPGAPGAPAFERFCALLVEKGRASLLRGIAASYRAAIDAAVGTVRLEVEAARETAPGLLDRLGRAWALSAGAGRAVVRLRLNPALIAGYRLRSGSVLVDYSVAGRLERLRRELARPLGGGKEDRNAAATR